MPHSISTDLYDWMSKRRIESEVAREMGIPVNTLLSELNPDRTHAKLGADMLVPLFEAIRRIGYGSELNGLLYPFIKELKGKARAAEADEEMIPQVLSLVQSLGSLSSCADRIPSMTEITELQRIRMMLATEVLPIVLQMEAIVTARIHAIRPAPLAARPEAQTATIKTRK